MIYDQFQRINQISIISTEFDRIENWFFECAIKIPLDQNAIDISIKWK